MPKKQIIGSVIIIVILSFICMYIYDNYKIEATTTLKVNEEVEEEGIKEYYKDKKSSYYLYNISSIAVDFTDRDLDLNRALEAKQITMDEVLDMLNKKYSIDNVTLYQNDNVSIIKCTLPGGKYNYILGGSSMEYEEGLCAEEPYVCKFDKTYYVIDISESKTTDNMYLTIRNDYDTETSTIEVKEDLATELLENKYYQFTFGSQESKIDENIKSIFDNNIILNVQEILPGEMSTNDSDCK